MRYALVENDTQRVVRVVVCDAATAALQAGPGETLVEDPLNKAVPGATKLDPILGFVSDVVYTEEQTRARLVELAQALMDAFARSWGYDDIRSAVSYVGDPYARFNAEGLALRNWRSAVWAYLDALAASPLPDPLPTDAEFLAMLPAPPVRPV